MDTTLSFSVSLSTDVRFTSFCVVHVLSCLLRYTTDTSVHCTRVRRGRGQSLGRIRNQRNRSFTPINMEGFDNSFTFIIDTLEGTPLILYSGQLKLLFFSPFPPQRPTFRRLNWKILGTKTRDRLRYGDWCWREGVSGRDWTAQRCTRIW